MKDVNNSRSGLSQEELNRLWTVYKETDDAQAKESLLLHYTYLVKWIVRRMTPCTNSYNEYDDYVSSGVIGLIDAVDKFDLKHGVKFETYAVPRIRGEILDYMRSQDWAPPSLRKKINAIDKAYEKYENMSENTHVDRLVADELGMPVEQVQKIQAQTHMFNLMNFEEAISSTANTGKESLYSEDNTPENSLIEKEKKAILAKLIDSLSEKERLVISLYYYEGLLLKEIAEVMGVTESRVSQIHSRVLAKMRTQFDKAV